MSKNYARIDGALVVELFATADDIAEMFHPDLVWVAVGAAQPKIGWSYLNGVFAPPIVLAVLLADLKAVKNTEINNARLAANHTTFLHNGKAVACDELSRGDIDGTNGYVSLYGTLPPGWPGGWKAVDNSYLTIADVAAWKLFYSSMYAAGNANFSRAQTLKNQLAAATTAAQVAAITW